MFLYYLGTILLLTGYLWFIERGAVYLELDFDSLARNYWYYYLIYTVIFLATSIWWVHNSEAWWDALLKRYGEPLKLDPKHFGFPTIPSVLNVAESSNFVFLTATTEGLILRRPMRKKVYLPWERIKKISVDIPEEKHRMAKLEVIISEGILDIMEVNWSDELTSWIPSSVDLIEHGKYEN